jgi:tripartite-type tricarboxylate transporter receptor subunit TctC
MAPAGTPPAVVARLHAAFVQALAAPETRRQFAALGIEPVGDTPLQFAAALQADLQRWRDLVGAQGRRE